jgi:hypothetical protein
VEKKLIKLWLTEQIQFDKTFSAAAKMLAVARKRLTIEIGNTHESMEMSIHGLAGRKTYDFRAFGGTGCVDQCGCFGGF